MRKFIEIARKSLGIQLAGFYLLENDKFVLRYILGTKNEPEVRELSFSSRLVQWMSTHKKALVREEELHVLSESEMAELNRDFSHTEAEAAVPVFYKGVLTGFLVLGYKSNKDAFLEEDIHFLETLAPQVAVAIENSRLFSEATTDGLTGLYHQKYFKARLKSEFERAVRHGHNLILALVDIDHFKRVNDNYGHLMGDAVLKGVAKILHNSFRIEDLVARYGGEEFAILLNEPNPKAARLVAERIRKRVENFHFEHGIRVTVSIGLYVLENSSDCPNELELIQRADEALYKAKNSGRNRVIFFEEVSRIKAVNSAS
jgi:diguanylate cyclase (GGDEF)-like protein